MAGRSAASYQRELRQLRDVIAAMQWVQPRHNGAPSCAGCGRMRHHGCADDCQAARVTGDRGKPEGEGGES